MSDLGAAASLPPEDISDQIASVREVAQADTLAGLRREMLAFASMAVLLTTGAAAVVAGAFGAEGALRWSAFAGGGLAWTVFQAFRYQRLHRGVEDGPILGHIGLGTAVTFARGVLASFLLGFLGLDSAGRTWAWAPTLLYTTIAVLDNFDGRLARRSGMATPMGARLDMEYDALGNLAGYAVAVRFGQLPPAFLTLGFLRYVFVVSHWVLEKRGRRSLALPESRARRIVASLQSGFLVGVLWPTVRPPVTTVAAALMGGALLASFGRDWLVSAGWVDAGDQAYRRAGKWVSEALFVFLPIPIRVAAAALMASSAVQPALSAPLGTAWARLGMVVAAGMLVLGAAARAAALAFLAAIALWAGDTAAPAGLGIVAGCGLVILLGSGASSLWEPEKRLFPE